MSEIVQPLPLCDSAVFSALHDQLASLGRHAQLTRCFSAVAELLVLIRRSGVLVSIFTPKRRLHSIIRLMGYRTIGLRDELTIGLGLGVRYSSLVR